MHPLDIEAAAEFQNPTWPVVFFRPSTIPIVKQLEAPRDQSLVWLAAFAMPATGSFAERSE